MAAGHNPLEQFELERLVPIHIGGVDASFTNSALFMVIAAVLATLLLVVGTRHKAMVPGRLQSIAELSFEFIANMVNENVGAAGRPYIPFVFTLFMFVLFADLLGMIPYTFTSTSHIAVTFAMAFFIFILVTIIGLVKHGFKFFSLFVPHGVPWPLLLILVPIEIISYLIRPITLSVRLFANMMAGHTMVKIIAGFIVPLGFLAGWVPLLFIAALTGLEIGIAGIQAFIFAILTCIYLNDALHLHGGDH